MEGEGRGNGFSNGAYNGRIPSLVESRLIEMWPWIK
jgi:hypothetical protein